METTDEEEERLLFRSSPHISFKMDRKCKQASKLKDAVSKKLFDFLGNYSDDVLAEYIVVLVCNGKHQSQARDDLEAFLGDDSGKFITWLWNHLSKENYISRTHSDSNLKAEVRSSNEEVLNKEQQSTRPPCLHTHSARNSDIPLHKDERYEPLEFNTNSNGLNTLQVSESLQRWCPSIDAPLNEVNIEISHPGTLVMNKDSCVCDSSGAMKYLSSAVRCSPEIVSGGEQCLHYESQDQKIAKIHSNAIPRRSLSIPRTEQAARSLRSIVTEDHQSRPLSKQNSAKIKLLPTVIDGVPPQITKPRGSVWDRLGKPCNEEDTDTRGKMHLHGHNPMKRERLDCKREELQDPRMVWVAPDARLNNHAVGESGFLVDYHGKVIPKSSLVFRTQEHDSSIMADVSPLNSKRTRMYGESNSGNSSASLSGCKGNDLQVKETTLELQGSLPIMSNHLQSSNDVTSATKNTTKLFPESARQSATIAAAEVNSQANNVYCHQLNRSALMATPKNKLVASSNQLTSKSESPSGSEHVNANRRLVKTEVLDAKTRRLQVEMDVLKLRLRQAELKNDTKPNLLSGVQKQPEEDTESRTVLVTNVHFAASREALLSHFAKCGVIIKVVMLTDSITAQPKGAACIVFANKDSVDKAIALSGTSFFSRILTVMKKAEMPAGFLVPPQQAGKHLQPFNPQSYGKAPIQRHTSTHLQWRRDFPASRENSIPATRDGLGTSNAGG